MLQLLKPVFESIWKRKETKIFIGLAFLLPLIVLISSFLPEGHNFYGVQSSDDGIKMAAVSFISGMIPLSFNLFLPTISFFYLTYTVFRGEADSRTLFLYKDIKRADIFWAKLLSLVSMIFIHISFVFLAALVVFYARYAQLDFTTMDFWSADMVENYDLFLIILGESFSMTVCAFLAAFLSLKKGLGVTMAASFIYMVVLAIVNNTTNFAFLLPLIDRQAYYNGGNFFIVLGTAALVTLIYSSGLAHLTLKHFKGMEY